MKLPTSYLPKKIRSAVRFTVIGTTGMFVQTWCFMAALLLLGHPEKGVALYYVAFGIGYILEMIPNYLFTNWYTFGTKPDIKNAGGFLVARAINLAIQLGLLPLMLIWLSSCVYSFSNLTKNENLQSEHFVHPYAGSLPDPRARLYCGGR